MSLLRVGFLSLSLLVLTGCSEKKQALPEAAVEVTAIKVEPRDIPAIVEYVGFAQSSHPVEIRARVVGYLDKIAYVEGSQVKVGQLLFQLDPRPFQAALDAAKAELAKNEAILVNANKTVARYTPLYMQHAASQRDLDDATTKELAAAADVEAAQANVVTAQLNLAYTTITSPIDGLTSMAKFREGSLISPGQYDLMATVSVLDPIWIYFSVPERDILSSRQDLEKKRLRFPKDMNFDVEAILADGSTYSQKGKVDFTAPTLDQNTGTMNVRAVFPNPKGVIKPGLFIRSRVFGAYWIAAFAVPQRSVQQGSKGMYVFVIDASNKVTMRTVETGDWYQDYWIITGGLVKGDVVVVDGVNKIHNGSEVKINQYIPLATDTVLPAQASKSTNPPKPKPATKSTPPVQANKPMPMKTDSAKLISNEKK